MLHIYIKRQHLNDLLIAKLKHRPIMNRAVSPEEATLRFGKMVIAHLVTSVHRFDEFQDIAIEMLSQLLIETIKALAERVKQILSLQKRTLPNSLHLLVASDQMGLFSREEIFHHLVASSHRGECFQKSELLRHYGSILFSSMQKANGYVAERRQSNITYVPPAFTVDPAKAIPHKRQIYRFFTVFQPEDNNCLLRAYSLLNPSVIEITDEQQEDVVVVNHKDKVRQMYAARNKISQKFANRMRREGKQRVPRQIGKTTIELDSCMEGLPKSVIDLDSHFSNIFSRNFVIIDTSE